MSENLCGEGELHYIKRKVYSEPPNEHVQDYCFICNNTALGYTIVYAQSDSEC